MTAGKSVLFICHEASRGGATLMLIHFLRWLKANTVIPFGVVVCRRGEMADELAELAPVWYLRPPAGRGGTVRAALRKVMRRGRTNVNVVPLADLAAAIRKTADVGLIYSNTIINGSVLEALSGLNCPILTHVHELEYQIHTFAGEEEFELVRRHTDHYVAVSEAVRNNLVARRGVPYERIECIRGFILTKVKPRADSLTLRRALTTELGIPENARIVGGCGPVIWHKGSDLFLQLALALRARTPSFPVHLLWMGTTPSEDDFYGIRHDLEHAGLTHCVHFIGGRSNPLDYIATFDVFALASREDSFPLVVLEAALLAVPTVCFEHAGGAQEFVDTDAGYVVPYLDVNAMADRVLELLRADELRGRLGRRAQEKVVKEHDIEVMAPRLLGTIERMLTLELPVRKSPI